MAFERMFVGPGPLWRLLGSMWQQQIQEWDWLQSGLQSLRSAKIRSFTIGPSEVQALCHPARIRSSAARTDSDALARRSCFLCQDALPREQAAVIYQKAWLIVCNPAPINQPHFTVIAGRHRPQRLEPAVEAMIDLAADLEGRYTLFYNGPAAGASAPDHLHVQGVPVASLPFERELVRQVCRSGGQREGGWLDWVTRDEVRLGLSRSGHRPVVILIGRERERVVRRLHRCLEALHQVDPSEPEPRVNLFATYADESWVVWFHPRAAHRPSVYGDGPDQFLISPGSVDVSGLLIVPRESDFIRLDAPMIERIYGEVLLPPRKMAQLREALHEAFGVAARRPARVK